MTPEDRIKQLRPDATPTEAEWLEFRNEAHRSLSRRRIAAVAGGLGLVVAIAVGGFTLANMDTRDRRGPGIAGTPSPSGAPSPHTSPSSDPEPAGSIPIQQWFFENDKLQVFYAHIRLDAETPVRDAAEELVKGVPSVLAETGVSTAIPDGTRVTDVSVSGRTASVTLVGDFPDETDTQESFATAQLVYTLTQFRDIDDVAISWESADSGGVAAPAQEREFFEDLLSPIVVEAPHPDQEVYRVFNLKGIANVFEATVSWRLTSDEGEVFKEGFTTATCGSGCWGTFEDRITLERVPGERIVLEVFQSSAEDGSPMNMVRIPLEVQLN